MSDNSQKKKSPLRPVLPPQRAPAPARPATPPRPAVDRKVATADAPQINEDIELVESVSIAPAGGPAPAKSAVVKTASSKDESDLSWSSPPQAVPAAGAGQAPVFAVPIASPPAAPSSGAPKVAPSPGAPKVTPKPVPAAKQATPAVAVPPPPPAVIAAAPVVLPAPPVIDVPAAKTDSVPARKPTPSMAARAAAEEARRAKRFPFEVEVDIVSEHNFYAGLSLNISEGGIFVATHTEYPVGTRVEIRLLFPGDEEPTNIMTEVRWVRPHNENADGSAGLGLRFVDVSPPVLEKIAGFARSRDPLYYEDD
jgi:uncharacterized protein (TIGR02266 family)